MLFLLPHKGDGIQNQNPHPPDDNASSDALLGYVEKPVKYKYIRGKNHFLVKWMGCPDKKLGTRRKSQYGSCPKVSH